ncbi:MAG TPA: 1-acyl-sn-glycerol-3-phosphate acyltransferase [Hanamia sp.]|nr:1-acyl-sn-glycerol-3-phosphate acyltransferase [Hanamia sp.]
MWQKKLLLYKIFLLPARIAVYFYCRKIIINNKAMLREQGPLLIAANHPNSFLDAIILGSIFRMPIYSLARGDAFSGKMISKILMSLNMLPVYRVSEGVENLENNYSTFNDCQKLFQRNKIILIFSEGLCVNEWHLRPLKKGTARLAFNAWQNNIPLKVLPLGINYSSFRFYGKNVFLNFGNLISQKDIHEDISQAKSFKEFDEKLQSQLEDLVYEIDSNDKEKLKKYFYVKQSILKKIILFIPAIIGFIINAPLYFAIHLIIKNRANDHYDSIMIGLLFFLFPMYVLIITLIVFFITKSGYSLLLLALLPFTVWSYLQVKRAD